MSLGEATYQAWVDQVLDDLGPGSMQTPIKIQLVTGDPNSVQAVSTTTYNRARDLFDAATKGSVQLDQIEKIEIAGDTYTRADGVGWIGPRQRAERTSQQGGGHPLPISGSVFTDSPSASFYEIGATAAHDRKSHGAVPAFGYEEVDKPPHYDLEIDGRHYQAIDLIEAMGLDFHTASALKYIVRAGSKPGAETVTDLRKAAWYLNRRADFLDRK